MKPKSRTIWSVCVVFFVAIAGCDGGTRVRGRVTDVFGQPIAGAMVTLDDGTFPVNVTTEEDGEYEVGTLHSPNLKTVRLSVLKDGYNVYHETVPAGHKRETSHTIRLQPETGVSENGLPPASEVR